jgi:hypothetical protein
MCVGAGHSGFERVVIDAIQIGDEIEANARCFGRGLARVEDLATNMCPAADAPGRAT